MSLVPIISLLVVLVLSLLIVRIATVALALTGLSQQLARFQARSAFTGAGFTTTESEKVVAHPVRRRIIMLLMLLGNAGIVTAVSSLILSFTQVEEGEGLGGSLWLRVAALTAGLLGLWAVAQSEWVDQWLSRAITVALKRWTRLDVRDYSSLLHLSGDYAVAEISIREGDWLTGKTLARARLNDEGVLVLGLERAGGKYVGAPRGQTTIQAGDTVILYGRKGTLQNLDQRPGGGRGNWEHVEQVGAQAEVRTREETGQEEASSTEADPDQESR
jgi:hypothetical protein